MLIMDNYKSIKCVIFDLDGVIIDTEELHKKAWMYACRQYGVATPTREMLDAQKGLSGDIAARLMMPEEKYNLVKEFREAKAAYIVSHLSEVSMLRRW